MRRRSGMRLGVAVVLAGGVLLLGAAAGSATDGFNEGSATAVNVAAGGTATANESVHLDARPPKADVVLAFDTTGSMGSVLDAAKADANAIVSSLQDAFPGGVRFAIADFQDVPPFDTIEGDHGYQLDRGFTSDISVSAAIGGLTLGDGGDIPESYFATFVNVSQLPWAADAERFLVVLGDQTGHDPNQAADFPACPNGPEGSGTEVVGDLNYGAARAVGTLAAANVSLNFVTYRGVEAPDLNDCHAQLAAKTGGVNVSAADATTLVSDITTAVNDAAAHIGTLDAVATTTPDGGTGPDPESNPGSWVHFTGFPEIPGTAPLDQTFQAVVEPPADAVPGTYHVDITVQADGVARTTQTLAITVKEPLADLNLSVTPTTAGAGITKVKIADIPNAWLSYFAGTTSESSTPVGSVPTGSTPVGSVPVGSVPVGSVPVGSVPVGSVPVGSVPVGSVPVGSVGLLDLSSSALNSLLLSQLPLCGDTQLPATDSTQCKLDGATWAQVLGTSSFAGKPLNALSLGDVLADPGVKTRFAALPLKDVGVGGSLFKSVRFSSLMVGPLALESLPAPSGYTGWCAGATPALPDFGGSCAGITASTSVLQADVSGGLGSAPVGSVPVGSVPVGSVPVGSVPVGSVDIAASRLAAVKTADMAPAGQVVTCAPGCATLGDAYAANAILPVSFSSPALAPALAAANITVNDIVAAMINRAGANGLPWERLPMQGLQPYSADQSHVKYTVSASVDCSVLDTVSFSVQLPQGFFPVDGTAKVTVNGGTATDAGTATPVGRTVAEARKNNRFAWSLSCDDAGTLVPISLSFEAYVGLRLGTFTSRATAAAGDYALSTDGGVAPVTVTQNGEPGNDTPDSAQTIASDTLVVGHIAASGDQDFYNVDLSSMPRGTKVAAYLQTPTGTDLDLTISKPATPSFFSTPVGSVPVGSVPIEDNGVGFTNTAGTLPSETLQDVPVGSVPVGSVPVGSVPVGSVSANRGDANEAAQILTTGDGGVATIGISGYNGASSSSSYTLRVQVTPPPPIPATCPARPFTVSSANQGTLPASLPSTTKSLFIVNKQRLIAMYGATAVNSMLSALTTLAARPEVAGTILYVDGSAAVRAAYASWDAKPCDANLANAVVRSINDVVASYRNSTTGLPSLHYIVLTGSDEATPFARTPDPVTLSPEENVATDLAFTTNGLTAGNALYNSAAENNILTDGAYGAFLSIPWLGRDLLLPQLSISRLVETPADMLGQINRYLQSSGYTGTPQTGVGTLNPQKLLTTGYDFLADGAQSIKDNLHANFGSAAQTDTIGGHNAINVPGSGAAPWTAPDIFGSFFVPSGAADIAAINAHYNHHEFEAADGSLGDTTGVSPTAGIASRILFTMGCHGGLNVSDTLSALTALTKDWPQLYSGDQVAAYIGNTGFGYGDSESVALSERLLSLFARNLHSDASSVGEQWAAALQQYFATAGAYDVYDEKVMEETTFYGLPFWHFSTPGTAPAFTPFTTTTDAATGSQVKVLSFPVAGALQQTQFGLYRPQLPLSSFEVTSTSLPARGVWVNDLTTDDQNATASIGYPTIDLAAHEPKPNVNAIFFPANPFTLARAVTFGKERDFVNVSGQFRPNTGSALQGVKRTVIGAQLKVLYSNSNDRTPPLISQVSVTYDAGAQTAIVRARATDETRIADAAALVHGNVTHWITAPLHVSPADPTLYVSDPISVAVDPEVVVEFTDGVNVSMSTNKGQNFTSAAASSAPGPLILLQAPLGPYALNQPVNATYQCAPNPATVTSCVGTVPSGSPIDTSSFGPHTFVVKAKDSDGNETSLQRSYVVAYPFKGFFAPVDNEPTFNTVNSGQAIPVKFSLSGNQGLDIFAAGYPKSQTIACDASAPADGVETTLTAGSSSLSYDPGSDQYTYVWKTDKSWGNTCRALILKLKDGSTHRANFKFTK